MLKGTLNPIQKSPKSTPIVKQTIAHDLEGIVISLGQNQHVSIMCNGSNDRVSNKMFGNITENLLNRNDTEAMKTFFLDMPIVNIGNAEHLFDVLDKRVASGQILWANAVSFVSNNCTVA